MREPEISFVNELEAQIINDLRRLQHYTMMLLNYKSQLALRHMVSFMVVPKYARHEGFVNNPDKFPQKRIFLPNHLHSQAYQKEQSLSSIETTPFLLF